jgi:hypothetical protein
VQRGRASGLFAYVIRLEVPVDIRSSIEESARLALWPSLRPG